MSRAIQIGNINTYDDWGLILTKCELGYPMPKTNYVDIPRGDGSIDLTEALTGEVVYENRTGSIEFDLIVSPLPRAELLNKIAAHVHGRKHAIVLPDEPDYVYISRLAINNVKTSYLINKIVLDVVSEPYKLKPQITVQEATLINDGSVELNLQNDIKPSVPKITTDAEITATMNDVDVTVNKGVHVVPKFKLKAGDNIILIRGDVGTNVKIEYQEGAI